MTWKFSLSKYIFVQSKVCKHWSARYNRTQQKHDDRKAWGKTLVIILGLASKISASWLLLILNVSYIDCKGCFGSFYLDRPPGTFGIKVTTWTQENVHLFRRLSGDRNVSYCCQISVNFVDLLLIMFVLYYMYCTFCFLCPLIMSSMVNTHHQHMYVSKLLVHTWPMCVHREAFGMYIINICTKEWSFWYIHQHTYISKKLLAHTPQPMYISRNLLKPWIQSHCLTSTDET
jgi:hypothetical protein